MSFASCHPPFSALRDVGAPWANFVLFFGRGRTKKGLVLVQGKKSIIYLSIVTESSGKQARDGRGGREKKYI